MEERRRPKKKMKLWKKILLTLFILIIALIGGAVGFWKFAPEAWKNAVLQEVTSWDISKRFIEEEIGEDLKEIQDTEFEEENVSVNPDVYEKLDLSGYTNIALFGIDERTNDFDSGSRSDSIIIVSINNDTKAIRMISVYRDTLLKQSNGAGSYTYKKANNAYNTAGVEGALSMLNTNLDLDIKDYAVVNFSGLAKVIDELGGITIKVTAKEQEYINFYLKNLRAITGMKSSDLKKHGKKVKLNGMQAVAFCRIRYCTFTDTDGVEYNNDLGRTARQRYVITKLVNKAKKLSIGELMKFAKTVLNMNTKKHTYFKTSMSTSEILDLIPTMIGYNITGTEGFPFTLAYADIDGASMVIPAGLSYNVKMLHTFLFDDDDYEPSATVADINYYIRVNTGIPEYWLSTEEEEQLSPSYKESKKKSK